jgi:hypothetical protein
MNSSSAALGKLSLLLVVGCSSSGTTPGPQPDAASPSGASCVGAAPTTGLGAYDSSLIAQIQAASLIFRATVTQVHGKTIPDPVDTTNLVVAQVTATAYASQEIHDLGTSWGNTLTIDLATANLAVGDSGFFIAQVEIYNGGQLEVKEITRVDETQLPHIASDVPRMMQLFAQNPLYARVASSRAIVAASVGMIVPQQGGCGSEHCADWELAAASTQMLLCGSAMTPLTVGFSGSTDIAWYQAPKLTTSQQGVLLLHHAPVPIDPEMTTPQLIVVDPLDVHPMADETMIAGLLASPPPLP